MLNVGKQQNGMTLNRWLRRGPSRREVLLTSTTHANAMAAGVKAERNRGYDNNERFVCGKQGYKQWDCPQRQAG